MSTLFMMSEGPFSRDAGHYDRKLHMGKWEEKGEGDIERFKGGPRMAYERKFELSGGVHTSFYHVPAILGWWCIQE